MKPEKKSKSDPAQGMRDAMKKATTEMLVLLCYAKSLCTPTKWLKRWIA